MNVLYLHAHDAGRWIRPYGHDMPTPHLAQLAREGMLFRQAFCANPTCSPSRAALLTGQTAHESGMLGLAHRGFSLADPRRHLAFFLRERGFETALFGIQHEFGREVTDKGYEREFTPNASDTVARDRLWAEGAAAFLRERRERPFFMACGFFMPHRAFPEADPVFDPAHIQPPPPLPDLPEVRQDVAAYMTAVRSMDECCGMVLDALHEGRHAEETLVIFTTDHGPAFPMMKCQLTDAGIGVSLIVRAPGQSTPGRACDALVSHLDLFPTVCDFLEIERAEWLEGQSLRPLLDDPTGSIREEIFAEVNFHAAYEAMRCVRTRRHKLIKIHDADLSRVPANVDDSPSKDALWHLGWFGRPREPVQLYDVLLDPGERENLADSPPHAGIRAALEERLDAWMRETRDPLLESERVPRPPGAQVNVRTARIPTGSEFETTSSP